MSRDTYKEQSVLTAIAPQAVADDTPLVSAIIDRNGYQKANFLLASGALADAGATFTVLLEGGDAANLSDAAAVADADMRGTESAASFTQADDNETRTLCYVGSKRYLRMTITPSGNGAAANFCVLAQLLEPLVVAPA